MVGIKKAKRLLTKAYYQTVRPDLVKIYKTFKNHTMVPMEQYCTNLELIERWIGFTAPPTSIVECGVWRGGMIGGIATVVNKYTLDCKYHLYDSFEGLPEANPEKDGQDIIIYQSSIDGENYYDNCKSGYYHVMSVMDLAGVKQKNINIHKGWFEDTINPDYEIDILRLDCDLYDSAKVCMDRLYPKLRTGGLLILDDYFTWDGFRRAVDEYGISVKTENGVAYVIKP